MWDRGLTYTLEPGSDVRRANREFDVRIRTNSLGVRDDEASLTAPEVIVLGDSFAMGFGVEQDESFPQQVEKMTGMRVLNAGIESYGTAREVLLAQRMETSNVKFLVVQYCPNDLPENASFLLGHGRPETLDREAFDSTLDAYLEARHYYPGKYLRFLASQAGRPAIDSFSPVELEEKNRAHAEAFLYALSRVAGRLHDANIIVVDLVDKQASYRLGLEPDYRSDLFRAELARLSRKTQYRESIRKMAIPDTGSVVDEGDRFILDGHLNARGHRKVAELVTAAIRTLQAERQDAHAGAPAAAQQ